MNRLLYDYFISYDRLAEGGRLAKAKVPARRRDMLPHRYLLLLVFIGVASQAHHHTTPPPPPHSHDNPATCQRKKRGMRQPHMVTHASMQANEAACERARRSAAQRSAAAAQHARGHSLALDWISRPQVPLLEPRNLVRCGELGTPRPRKHSVPTLEPPKGKTVLGSDALLLSPQAPRRLPPVPSFPSFPPILGEHVLFFPHL